jgi:hypothetical protein
MLPPFDLSLPSDARYRGLAPEVATKYAELAGCPAAASQGMGRDVETAATDLAPAGDDIAMTLSNPAGAVEVDMRCGERHTTVRTSR